MAKKAVKTYVVIPCYNEEEVLPETLKRLIALFSQMRDEMLISSSSQIVFVDDGSKDNTWKLIEAYSHEYKEVMGVKLAHNAGHQNALYGGLMAIKDTCDCAVSIDADLQDDINVIPDMIRKFRDENCEIVYGVRNKRDTDTAFKRTTALAFYKLMHIMGVDMVHNHADYRLMGKNALNALSEFEERNLFLRGIVPLIGYKSDRVYYDRSERFAGESKYPLKKMLSFAFDGITSFSINPIRLISTVGIVSCIFAIIMAIYAIVQKFMGNTDAGWASIMCSVWFIGGLQLLGTGLIGEYIGKMYKEVKRRPRYIIEKITRERADLQ